MKLNETQKLVVETKIKKIFLLAGAGSGKTRVIVERINYLLRNDVSPEDILCITFTNKASYEMKKRLDNDALSIYTFHSFCYKVLKSFKEFKIFEFNNEFSEKELLNVTNYKNSLKRIKKPIVYDRYQKYLKDRDLLDYDDLIVEAIPHVSSFKFKYVFIDEFQDTNYLQYELIKKLININTNLLAVGDPDQSIYAFRGAKVDLINKLINDYDATLIKLELNYRSNDLILKAANNLIRHNVNRHKKELLGNYKSNTLPKAFISNKGLEEKVIYFIKQQKLFNAVILYRNDYQITKLKQLLKVNYLFFNKCMTFHEAKGLEFNDVIIFGGEILPINKDDTHFNLEEERRLLFVGITRAINNLYIFSLKKTKFIKEMKIKVIKI